MILYARISEGDRRYPWGIRITSPYFLDNIETISVAQSILGRVLDYGTLTVHGTGREEIEVRMVERPVSLRRHIQLAREGFAEAPTAIAA